MCTPSASDGLLPSNLDTVLHPLDHQVSGHTQLMLLDPTTVCKPLIQRELLFYLRIPHELRPFVPNYKGVVQVRQVDGFPIIYHPIRGSKVPSSKSTNNNSSSTTTTSTATATTSREKSRIKFDPSSYRDGSSSTGLRFSHSHPELRVQLSSCNDKRLLYKDLSSELPSTRTSTSTSNTSYSSSTSSTANCYPSAKDHGYSSRPSQRYFLLLENIASQFHLPCILDLKMGTQQHGDDASAEKRSRQMAKCAATTSATLGVRLGGMQVYREDLGVYLWKDKYYGRKLDEDGFRDALIDFFHNGHSLRTYAIAAVINRLKAMREAVEHQQFFRFYSTSLLIAYEGCTGRRNHPPHPNGHHHTAHEGTSSNPSSSNSVPTVSVSPVVTEHDGEIDDSVDDEGHDDDTGSLESFSIDDDDARFYSPVKQNNRSRRAASQQLLSSVTKKSRHTTHSHSSSGDDDSSLENSLEFSSNSLNSSSGHHSRSFSGPFSSSSSLSSSSSTSTSQSAHTLLVSGQMKYRQPDRRWQYQCSRSDCHRRSSPFIDVRMIDFAHTVLASPWNSSSSLPTSSLTNVNEEESTSPSPSSSSSSSTLPSNQSERHDRQATQQQQQQLPTTSGTVNSTSNIGSSNKNHDNLHEGPDKGFLKGVNSLIRLLSEILESSHANGQDEMEDSDLEVETSSTCKEV